MESMIKQFVSQHFCGLIIVNCQCKPCRKAWCDSWGIGTNKLIEATGRQPCGGVDNRQKINSLTSVNISIMKLDIRTVTRNYALLDVKK